VADAISITDTIQVASLVAFLAVVGWLAVRFRATPAPREVAELESRIWHRASEQGERLQAEIDALRREIRDIRQENDELRAWVVELTQQVVGLGGKPVPRPRLYYDANRPAIDDTYNALISVFSREELEQIAFELGIGVENVPGATAPAYAMHLYQTAERTGKGVALTEVVRKARPGVAT
jgi:hypothetical protein